MNHSNVHPLIVTHRHRHCLVNASIITFPESQSGIPDPYNKGVEVSYGATVLDLPNEFRKIDTVFYLTDPYDPQREQRENAAAGLIICTANIGLKPLIVGDQLPGSLVHKRIPELRIPAGVEDDLPHPCRSLDAFNSPAG